MEHFKKLTSWELKYPKEQLEVIIKQSICWTDIMRALGMPFHGGYIPRFRKLAQKYNICYKHFDHHKALAHYSANKKSNDELFIENCTAGRASVKNRILSDNLIEYKCRDCDNVGLWNNKQIVLQLEHINGVRNDNRLENLCFLCPNCHSQTATFTGKNNTNEEDCIKSRERNKISIQKSFEELTELRNSAKNIPNYRKVNRPEKDELQELLWTTPTTKLAEFYNVSGTAIKKWAKQLGLNYPGRGYWQKKNAELLNNK